MWPNISYSWEEPITKPKRHNSYNTICLVVKQIKHHKRLSENFIINIICNSHSFVAIVTPRWQLLINIFKHQIILMSPHYQWCSTCGSSEKFSSVINDSQPSVCARFTTTEQRTSILIVTCELWGTSDVILCGDDDAERCDGIVWTLRVGINFILKYSKLRCCDFNEEKKL